MIGSERSLAQYNVEIERWLRFPSTICRDCYKILTAAYSYLIFVCLNITLQSYIWMFLSFYSYKQGSNKDFWTSILLYFCFCFRRFLKVRILDRKSWDFKMVIDVPKYHSNLHSYQKYMSAHFPMCLPAVDIINL